MIRKSIVSTLAIAVCLLIAMTANAWALNINDVVISGTYGTGENTSYLVVDFGTSSYAFAYNYDGAKTGANMLIDFDNSGIGLDVMYTQYSWGYFVWGFAYNNTPTRTPDAPNSGWHYYLASNGDDWAASWSGVSSRALSNGSWDGWSFIGYNEDWDPLGPAPVTPTVPEPSALVALCSFIGLAGSAKILRLRK